MFLRHFYNKSRNYFENLRRKSIKSCKKKVKKPYIIMYKAVAEPAHIQVCIKLLGKGKGWGSAVRYTGESTSKTHGRQYSNIKENKGVQYKGA